MVQGEGELMLIQLPDDLVNELMEISDSQGKPSSVYLTEILKQAVRAHKLNCSLKETIDLYNRTIIKKEAAEEAKRVEQPSIDEMFERTLAKLKPEITESEEHKMLSRFVRQLPGS